MREFFGDLFRGGTRFLLPYETMVFDALRDTLSPPGKILFERQMSRFNLFQRSPDKKLVAFYDTKNAEWREDELFPLRHDEDRIFRVWLRSKTDARVSIKGDIVLHFGRLSSLEFDKMPGPLRNDGAILDHAKLLLDPFLKCSSGELELSSSISRPPMSKETLVQYLESIDAPLPQDYLETVVGSDGFSIGDWRIYGLSQVRTMVQPDCTYYVLAESTDGKILAVQRGAKEPTVYFVDTESGVQKPLGKRLIEWVNRLKGKV